MPYVLVMRRSGLKSHAFQAGSPTLISVGNASETDSAFNITMSSGAALVIPTLQDERDYYEYVGRAYTAADEPQSTPSDSGFTVGSIDSIHNQTEADDLWSHLNMYNRLAASGHAAATRYLNRTTGWRNYFVNQYQTDKLNDSWGNCDDHCYGQGIAQYGQQFSDGTAEAKAVALVNDIRTRWGAPNYPTPGTEPMSYWAPRVGGRHLIVAVMAADATGHANAIELRDWLIDAWVASPDWLPTYGFYHLSQEQMGYEGLGTEFSNGLRVTKSWTWGILMEAFWRAYTSSGVSAGRKASLRTKMIAMSEFSRRYGRLMPRDYCGSLYGTWISGGSVGQPWHNIDQTGFADPVYMMDKVNTLTIGYKLTGQPTYLIDARRALERGGNGEYGGARLVAANEVHHFADSIFDGDGFANNGGELQYNYMVFENGGRVASEIDTTTSALKTLALSLSAGQWGQLTGMSGLTSSLLNIEDGEQLNHILGYCDSGVWDSVRKEFHLIGGAHVTNPPGKNQRHIRYRESTNSWDQRPDQSWFTSGNSVSHAYDLTAIDHLEGMLYKGQFSDSTVYRYNLATGAWSTIASLPGGVTAGGGSMVWFPAMGLRGSLIMFSGQYTADIYRWDRYAAGAGAGSWTAINTTLDIGDGFHQSMEPIDIHNCVLLSNDEVSGMWRLNPDESIQSRATKPWASLIYEGGMAACPGSGDLLLIEKRGAANPRMRRYRTVANTWDGADLPDAPWFEVNNDDFGFAHAPIHEYGVIFFLTYNFNVPEVWLYKPD